MKDIETIFEFNTRLCFGLEVSHLSVKTNKKKIFIYRGTPMSKKKVKTLDYSENIAKDIKDGGKEFGEMYIITQYLC